MRGGGVKVEIPKVQFVYSGLETMQNNNNLSIVPTNL